MARRPAKRLSFALLKAEKFAGRQPKERGDKKGGSKLHGGEGFGRAIFSEMRSQTVLSIKSAFYDEPTR